MTPNIILVGDFTRTDFLEVPRIFCHAYNFFFLEFLDESEVNSLEYKQYGSAIYWKDYQDAYNLLDSIKPAKVLFYFIESFNHVALNVACKIKGIPTFHLEHGIRNKEVTKFVSKNLGVILYKKKRTSFLKPLKEFKKIRNRIKNRKFFLKTIKRSDQTAGNFLREYYKVRSTNNIYDTFEKINSPLRVADKYISFSPKVFEFHKISDHLPDDYPVEFIGNPVFDDYAILKEKKLRGRSILLIDQPFHEQNLLGWTLEHKYNFYKSLIEVGREFKRKVYIKPHPLSDPSLYNSLEKNDMFDLIAPEAFKSIISECEIILGFASTLLLPLICVPHTVCFCFENHPKPLPVEYSKFLSDTKAITKVCSIAELKEKFEQIEDVKSCQKGNKEKFEKDWLFKFDGKSLERLKQILLDEAY